MIQFTIFNESVFLSIATVCSINTSVFVVSFNFLQYSTILYLLSIDTVYNIQRFFICWLLVQSKVYEYNDSVFVVN